MQKHCIPEGSQKENRVFPEAKLEGILIFSKASPLESLFLFDVLWLLENIRDLPNTPSPGRSLEGKQGGPKSLIGRVNLMTKATGNQDCMNKATGNQFNEQSHRKTTIKALS